MFRPLCLVFVTSFLAVGCKTTEKYLLGNGLGPDGEQVYLNSRDLRKDMFTDFIARHPSFDEEGKIQYLLAGIEHSEYEFIRNGNTFGGERAVSFLRWKRRHSQYRENPIRTAQDFVEHVADGSKASGRSYRVVLPDGRHEPLRLILHNELSSLEATLQVHRLQTSLSESSPEDQTGSVPIAYVPVSSGAHAS